MFLKNQMLLLLPSLAGSIDDLESAPRRPRRKETRERGVRVGYLELVGVMEPDYLLGIRNSLQKLAADETIGAIAFYINSPGGLAEGTPELAEIVARAGKVKPVHVISEGYLASAALWVASQATSITASPSTIVGSIGSVIVVIDDSEMHARLGVKVLRIASGPLKGTGIPGVKVEDEEVQAIRRRVDMMTAMFQAAIERGRRMAPKQLREIATGEAWLAGQAQYMGLIDQVGLYEDAMAGVLKQVPREKYADLEGAEALERWNALLISEFRLEDHYDASVTQESALAKKYPALAQAAAEYNKRR